jgi:predicted DsbA family dithiol-disulfide isomerase
MQIEIWSDVMCPFCYIGKRKFETALAQFPEKDQVQIVWKSFQLSPDLKTEPGLSSNDYLARHKGISVAEAQQMHDHVTNMAAEVGLHYDFSKAVVANSWNAHRFAHFAKSKGLQPEAEEALFKAYFTEGKNIDDYPTLATLGASIGLDAHETIAMLESDAYHQEVRQDIQQARQFGINGVPFFVFNRKYALSGAQAPETFLQALQQITAEAVTE